MKKNLDSVASVSIDEDKKKYKKLKLISEIGALSSGAIVAYIVRKQGGSNLKQLGFGLTAAVGVFGLGYFILKPQYDKLGKSSKTDEEIFWEKWNKNLDELFGKTKDSKTKYVFYGLGALGVGYLIYKYKKK
jgi:hypothetical protein